MTLKCFDKLSQDFTQLLKSEYDYNVIIKVGEKPNTQIFKVHSAILYQRSSYFQQTLINTIKNDNIIEINLPYISAKEFNIIINGKISLEIFEASAIFDLLITVDEFNLSDFQNKNFNTLQQFYNDILAKHPSMLFNSNDFPTLQEEDMLISLLERDDLQMEESEIWDEVILWGKKNTQNLPSELDHWTDEDFKSLKAILETAFLILDIFKFLVMTF
ncbi:hypothetical protein C2G38_2212261 [Gigaspora rosea]|uniref:BTB domain-containing protein n=1 Tax=Gigaspora rosea TaxID=44941 RepID=A0A397UCZ1_9GLOM|nr:hypothetical protein C2G38_2212261 [Gigaspora rosea]